MPLSFQSENHGRIAFGFFNIESDMLLLQHYFFFADSFCKYVAAFAGREKQNPAAKFEIYEIANPANVGDLMGAINGVRFTGFIGDTYRKFPFPKNPADFKQNPRGDKTQNSFREMIAPYAETVEIPFRHLEGQSVRIGEYIFDRFNFHELLRYVSRGGFPGWRDDIRPDYVTDMERRIGNILTDKQSGV